jgi:transcriptional regulator with XRE-family HTH domain
VIVSKLTKPIGDSRNDRPEQIAKRLRLTREALGYTQAIMCKLIGSATNGQAWENYESGRRKISLDHALRLCDNCGLSLEWIYRGNYQSLTVELRDKIIQQEREHNAAPPLPLWPNKQTLTF